MDVTCNEIIEVLKEECDLTNDEIKTLNMCQSIFDSTDNEIIDFDVEILVGLVDMALKYQNHTNLIRICYANLLRSIDIT